MRQVPAGLKGTGPSAHWRAALLRETSTRGLSESIVLRARLIELQSVQRSRLRDLRHLRLSARQRLDGLRKLSDDLRSQCAAPRPLVLRPAQGRRADSPLASAAKGELAQLHAEFAASRDPRLRAKLLARYDGFAVALARRFSSRRDSPEDMAQVARLGLLRALDRFDPSRGRPFATYAKATIVGELKRHVRDRTWSMRVPRSLQENYLVVLRVVDELTQELGRSPQIPEVARRAGLTEEDVLEAMELSRAQRPVSLDTPAGPEDGRPLDFGADDPGFGTIDSRALLGSLLARLSDRDRQILALRFGEQLTQAEIAGRLGVSQMYISRLLARTLARMRTWVATSEGVRSFH
jgi:RNA polymerase sigma-B factor